MPEPAAPYVVTEGEHRLAYARDRGLVLLVHGALLRAEAARLRESCRWHVQRRRWLVRELHILRGVATRSPGRREKPRHRRPRGRGRLVEV
jgi:hypothetical protein